VGVVDDEVRVFPLSTLVLSASRHPDLCQPVCGWRSLSQGYH